MIINYSLYINTPIMPLQKQTVRQTAISSLIDKTYPTFF